MRISMKNGIELEPFKIGWFQLLAMAALVGGYGVTLKTVVDNQSKSTEATTQLTQTMHNVNMTLVDMKNNSKHTATDVGELKKLSREHQDKNKVQDENILELQIITGIRK